MSHQRRCLLCGTPYGPCEPGTFDALATQGNGSVAQTHRFIQEACQQDNDHPATLCSDACWNRLHAGRAAERRGTN